MAGKQPATYADIEAAPENLVAEIINGELMTHPRPSPRHGLTASALGVELGGPFQKGVGGPGGWVFVTEPEIKFGNNILVPDLAAWRQERFIVPERNYFEVAPDFVCEILSGFTERRDRTIKKRIYAEGGVSYLWIIDPRLQVLEALSLRDGAWIDAGAWNSDNMVRAAPFDAVAFSLADLWPMDKPLGFHEDPTPLYAGDR
ncbi:Uma2 family endonuclease [Tianweitania sediminis]|uniref:Uma2 family endonuclease n=1 Tax=Tianweitania sediminis TaxID=1502156 RepID=UPI0031581FD5